MIKYHENLKKKDLRLTSNDRNNIDTLTIIMCAEIVLI